MKFLVLALTVCAMNLAHAEEKMKMYFNNEEVVKIIEIYSKASGQKFIIDPGVRGKVSIFLQESVGMDEAFNHLSSALAFNGFGISKQGDTMVVRSARNLQRDSIEVSTERPSLKPERMYTWIYNVKNLSAEQINRDLRVLPSKDGEMSINPTTNQIIISDWTSNLNRIAEIIKEVDKPLDPATAKIVEAAKKEREAHKKERDNNRKRDKED